MTIPQAAVAVVILNWNGRPFLEKFLPSLCKNTPSSVELLVADNASDDDSLQFLSAHYPHIRQICLKKNYGFAEGYNKALQQVKARYFVLLNSDIELTPNWLEPLFAAMENDDSLAACMPKLLSFSAKESFEYAGAGGGFIDILGYPFCRGRIFDTIEKDHAQYDTGSSIFWATGACLMVRAQVFEASGGFDARFFAHMEEIDWCWRVKNTGYRLWYVPRSVVYHVGGGTLPKNNPFKTFLNFRNNLFLITKNLKKRYLLWALPLRLLLDGIAGLQFLVAGQGKDFGAVIRAHFAFYRQLPSVWQQRQELQATRKKTEHSEIYPRSIVWDYFIKKKRKFSELPFDFEKRESKF